MNAKQRNRVSELTAMLSDDYCRTLLEKLQALPREQIESLESWTLDRIEETSDINPERHRCRLLLLILRGLLAAC